MIALYNPETPHRQCRRDIETLRIRSRWLAPDDHALMEMIFEKGSTFEAVSRLTGQSPSTVCRRFHRLLHKLVSEELIGRLRRRGRIEVIDIHIIRDYYLRGRSQKVIARNRNISLYRVRRILQQARFAAMASHEHNLGAQAVSKSFNG